LGRITQLTAQQRSDSAQEAGVLLSMISATHLPIELTQPGVGTLSVCICGLFTWWSQSEVEH